MSVWRTDHASASTRGAVLLLSVYLTALSLLLLGGLSLQRTITETRSASLSRDQAQAFWLAEGAVDSALMRVKQQLVPDTDPQSVLTAVGQADFTLTTLSASLLPGTPFQQQLMRRIDANGRIDENSRFELSSHYSEQGPLVGVAANGLIVIHGGTHAQEAFVHGHLLSNLGSVVATVPTRSRTLQVDGLVKAENQTDLGTKVTQEMRSLKNGYVALAGVREDYSRVRYVTGEATEQIPPVDGLLMVGMGQTVEPQHDVGCSHDLRLNDSLTVINDGFHNRPLEDTSGSSTDGRIVLCVNSILPQQQNVYGDFLTGYPHVPELRFTAPATVYVTGSDRVNLTNELVHLENGMLIPGAVFEWFNVQRVWYVSVAAKLSAVDAFGQTIPNGIQIVQRDRPRRDGTPGVMVIKPGRFSGSVVAPESLVLVRTRDAQDRPCTQYVNGSCTAWSPLELQHVVGNEVIVELENEQLQFGIASSRQNSPATTTQFLSWTSDQ